MFNALRAKRFWQGHEAEELPKTTLGRLKHILVDNIVYRRINQRRDKVRGNHYVTHFRVRNTHNSKTDANDYIGVVNLGHVLLPKKMVGKLIRVEMRIFDDRILPEKPTFFKEKDILDEFKDDR